MQPKPQQSIKQAMVRQLKREGAAAQSRFDQPLCDRIMGAVDRVQQEREANRQDTLRRKRFSRAKIALALTTAAALLVAIGLGLRPEPRLARPEVVGQNVPIAEPRPAVEKAASMPSEPADDLFSAPAVAVESLSALQAGANPLDELEHDAQLAGQMALSVLPLSGLATD